MVIIATPTYASVINYSWNRRKAEYPGNGPYGTWRAKVKLPQMRKDDTLLIDLLNKDYTAHTTNGVQGWNRMNPDLSLKFIRNSAAYYRFILEPSGQDSYAATEWGRETSGVAINGAVKFVDMLKQSHNN